MMGGFGTGMTAAGWVFMSAFWVLLIAAIVWAISRLLPERGEQELPRPVPPEAPEAILDRRLALGEIDVDTYDALRDRLRRRDAEPAEAVR